MTAGFKHTCAGLVTVVALLSLTTTAFAQGRPYVPRWQGPAEPTGNGDSWELIGLAFLGSGAVASGVGLYLLESGGTVVCHDTRDDGPAVCEEQTGDRIELGAGLLIGGVFLAGFGVYLVASSLPDPVGLDGPVGQEDLIHVGLGIAPTRAGAVVVGDVRF
mgnify:CR=1 FL=1